MQRKAIVPWITLMAIPIILVGLAFVYDFIFGEAAHDYSGAVNDNLLNTGGVIFFLAYVSVVFSAFLYPIWIFMLIRAVRFNKKFIK